jgi:hypothetical protein
MVTFVCQNDFIQFSFEIGKTLFVFGDITVEINLFISVEREQVRKCMHSVIIMVCSLCYCLCI